jgi:uncharacterized protein YjbJ (UPF0337 family)
VNNVTNFQSYVTLYAINIGTFSQLNIYLQIILTMQKITINWEYQKEKLKERFASLTDKDLQFEQGKMEEMLTKLQNKVGKTRHELHTIIAKL